jgi:hypothetical protein
VEEKKTEKEEEAEVVEGESVWRCEFCGHANHVELEEEEVLVLNAHSALLAYELLHSDVMIMNIYAQIPKAESLDYLLEPAPISGDSTESNIVFVIGT